MDYRYTIIVTLILLGCFGYVWCDQEEQEANQNKQKGEKGDEDNLMQEEDLNQGEEPGDEDRTFLYKWPQGTDNYDYMAALAYRYLEFSAAVILSRNCAITAANPLYQIYWTKGLDWKGVSENVWRSATKAVIRLRAIDGAFNRNKVYRVTTVGFQYNISGGTKAKMFSKGVRYSPMHDLATLAIKPEFEFYHKLRAPIPLSLTEGQQTSIKQEGTFHIAGFGYIDRLHVRQQYELEVVEYSVSEVWQNCDEWLPRNWGYFICILNIENFVGVEAGSALTYNGVLVGIGSFALTRGSESILLFTDVRRYTGIHFHIGVAKEHSTYYYNY